MMDVYLSIENDDGFMTISFIKRKYMYVYIFTYLRLLVMFLFFFFFFFCVCVCVCVSLGALTSCEYGFLVIAENWNDYGFILE